MTTIQEIREHLENAGLEVEMSTTTRGAMIINALSESDAYGDKDDSLESMAQDALTDLRHAFDLVGLDFAKALNASLESYSKEVAAFGTAEISGGEQE